MLASNSSLALLSAAVALASSASAVAVGLDVSGLIQSDVRLVAEALSHEGSAPTMDLEQLDSSDLAARLLGFLQSSRFYKSFQFFNNMSAVASDLFSSTQNELRNLKSGLAVADEANATQLVEWFFHRGQQVAEMFLNATDAKLQFYLGNLSTEDAQFVQPAVSTVTDHMRQILTPMFENVQLMQGASDVPSVCKLATTILADLTSVDKMIEGHIVPALNRTALLLHPETGNSSRGRMKMLKRFTDLGYSVLERVRSVAVLVDRTVAPLLAEHLHCGGALADAARLSRALPTQVQAPAADAEAVEATEADNHTEPAVALPADVHEYTAALPEGAPEPAAKATSIQADNHTEPAVALPSDARESTAALPEGAPEPVAKERAIASGLAPHLFSTLALVLLFQA